MFDYEGDGWQLYVCQNASKWTLRGWILLYVKYILINLTLKISKWTELSNGWGERISDTSLKYLMGLWGSYVFNEKQIFVYVVWKKRTLYMHEYIAAIFGCKRFLASVRNSVYLGILKLVLIFPFKSSKC